jgi:branched-chain amino acid aminotransferase/4-amino-4-deoxychorismate lyase
MYLLYNFDLIEEEDFKLPYTNRGFQYNDGFFDTLVFAKGRIRFLADHLDRMHRAVQVLNLLPIPQLSDLGYMEQQITSLIELQPFTADVIRIKINIWRQAGGLFTPETNAADILIAVQPQGPIKSFITEAGFYNGLRNRFTPFSFFKGPYALHYVQASLERNKLSLDELILLDEQDHIAECLVANIFWIKGNELFTPALETGCIAGIMRLQVLRACKLLQVPVQEGTFSRQELLTADLIFASNVTGLRPILKIEGYSYQASSLLLQHLKKLVMA